MTPRSQPRAVVLTIPEAALLDRLLDTVPPHLVLPAITRAARVNPGELDMIRERIKSQLGCFTYDDVLSTDIDDARLLT